MGAGKERFGRVSGQNFSLKFLWTNVTLLTHKKRMKPKSPKRTRSTPPPAVRKFFPWLYYAMERDLGNRCFTTQIHKTRDGLAALEASQLFTANGFTYGGSILNVPQDIREELGEKAVEHKIPLSPGDLVYFPTRPPLDDDDPPPEGGARRCIRASGTDLEIQVFKRLRSVFKTCTRSRIDLRDELRFSPTSPKCAPDFKALQFRQNQGGEIEKLHGGEPKVPEGKNTLAVGYLVTLPPLQSSPFRIVCCFGAGGTETLWFHFLLKAARSGADAQALGCPGIEDLFARALICPEIRVWMVPFVVPDCAPNWLSYPPGKLRLPKDQYRGIIEWSL